MKKQFWTLNFQFCTIRNSWPPYHQMVNLWHLLLDKTDEASLLWSLRKSAQHTWLMATFGRRECLVKPFPLALNIAVRILRWAARTILVPSITSLHSSSSDLLYCQRIPFLFLQCCSPHKVSLTFVVGSQDRTWKQMLTISPFSQHDPSCCSSPILSLYLPFFFPLTALKTVFSSSFGRHALQF